MLTLPSFYYIRLARLTTQSPNLDILCDGARCVHFNMEKTTDVTRVSIDFRIVIYNAKDGDASCSKEMRDDRFSQEPEYNDEAFFALGGGGALFAKIRAGNKLLVVKRRPSVSGRRTSDIVSCWWW